MAQSGNDRIGAKSSAKKITVFFSVQTQIYRLEKWQLA